MKKEIIVCDICGKPIDYNKHRKFKVHMKEFYWARNPYECFQELVRNKNTSYNREETET